MPRVWQSAAWLTFDKAVLLLSSLLSQVAIVRGMGVSEYGQVSYVLALIAILGPIAQAGATNWVVKALLERPDQQVEILRSALAWRLVGCALAIFFGGLYWALTESQSELVWSVGALLLAQSFSAFQVVDYQFQSSLNPGPIVRWRVAVTFSFALLKCAVAVTGGTVGELITLYAIEVVLLGLTNLSVYRWQSQVWLSPRVSGSWFQWFRGRSGWVVGASMAEILYLKIDVLMIEYFLGAQETGIYSVAARLSELWYLIPTIILAAWFPRLWSYRSSDTKWRAALQRSMDGLFVLALTVAIVIQFAAEPIVRLTFGEGVAGSAPILVVHIWAAIFIFMRAVVSRWLIAEDLPRYSLMTHVLGAMTNVLLNWWWIPIYGGLGAAYATLVSYAVAGWLSLFLSARTRPIALMMGRALCLPLRWREWRVTNV
jgi:O-antigen/teichoic acid export membrane protein